MLQNEQIKPSLVELVSPGYAFPVDHDYYLKVDVVNPDPTETISFVYTIRRYDAQGRVWDTPTAVPINVASGVLSQTRIPMTKGMLISANVGLPAGAADHQSGRVLVDVQLRYGIITPTDNQSVVVATLIHDYLCGLYRPNWPTNGQGGEDTSKNAIISLTPATPAAGAEMSFSLNANCRLEIMAVRFTLVTAAGGGNRIARLYVVGSTGITQFLVSSNVVHAGGLTKDYYFVAGHPIRDNTTAAEVIEPFPAGLTLGVQQGVSNTIATSTIAIAAGDTITFPQIFGKWSTV